MTDFDEALSDICYPDRGHTEIHLEDLDDDHLDEQHRVFVFIYGDQRVIVTPFTVPGDFSLEVSMFDADGVRQVHRVMGMQSGEVLTYTDADPNA